MAMCTTDARLLQQREWTRFISADHGVRMPLNCELGKHIRPEGWYNWNNPTNENTARYQEYNNSGEGAASKKRVAWSRQLTKKEAAQVTIENVFKRNDGWMPEK